jgi:hypothetical protein
LGGRGVAYEECEVQHEATPRGIINRIQKPKNKNKKREGRKEENGRGEKGLEEGSFVVLLSSLVFFIISFGSPPGCEFLTFYICIEASVFLASVGVTLVGGLPFTSIRPR